MSDDHRITLGDKERWKKHYRSAKRQAYAMSFGSLEYERNFDRINWKVKRADDPFRSVVLPDIGGDHDPARYPWGGSGVDE